MLTHALLSNLSTIAALQWSLRGSIYPGAEIGLSLSSYAVIVCFYVFQRRESLAWDVASKPLYFVEPSAALRGPRNTEALSKGPARSYTDTPFSADRKVCESMNVQKKVRGSISLLAMRTAYRRPEGEEGLCSASLRRGFRPCCAQTPVCCATLVFGLRPARHGRATGCLVAYKSYLRATTNQAVLTISFAPLPNGYRRYLRVRTDETVITAQTSMTQYTCVATVVHYQDGSSRLVLLRYTTEATLACVVSLP